MSHHTLFKAIHYYRSEKVQAARNFVPSPKINAWRQAFPQASPYSPNRKPPTHRVYLAILAALSRRYHRLPPQKQLELIQTHKKLRACARRFYNVLGALPYPIILVRKKVAFRAWIAFNRRFNIHHRRITHGKNPKR